MAQCGGEGNIASFLSVVDEVAATEPFAAHFEGFERTWGFAGAEETGERLRRAGFDGVRAWLEPSGIVPEDPADFLRSVTLGVHLPRLPSELRDAFVDEVLSRAGEPLELDYVRLNMEARRP